LENLPFCIRAKGLLRNKALNLLNTALMGRGGTLTNARRANGRRSVPQILSTINTLVVAMIYTTWTHKAKLDQLLASTKGV